MNRDHVLRGIVGLVAIVVTAFIALQIVRLAGDLGDAPRMTRPWLLVPGFALLAAGPVFWALVWRELLCRLDGERRPLLDVVGAFWVSWLGRYVPSSLPYVAGKVAMGRRLGHSKRALGAALVYENVLLISVGAAASSLVIMLTAGNDAGPLVYLAAALGGLAGLAVLSPRVMHSAANRMMLFAKRPPLARDEVLSYDGIAVCGALTAIGLVTNGAGFALVLDAFTSLSAQEFIASAAIFNLAGIAGILVVPVPSGLGVREAVLIGLLHPFVPLEVAAAAAIVVRLGGIIIDVVFGLLGMAIVGLRSNPGEVEEPTSAAPRQVDVAA